MSFLTSRDVITKASKAVERTPDRPMVRVPLIAAYAALGRTAEAQNEVAEVLRIDPKFSVSKWKRQRADYRDRAVIDKLSSLLVEAGLPEHPATIESQQSALPALRVV